MLAMTIMREFFMICVPLFITLSGYLLCKKELSVKYYSRIWGILITYVLASLLCIGGKLYIQIGNSKYFGLFGGSVRLVCRNVFGAVFTYTLLKHFVQQHTLAKVEAGPSLHLYCLNLPALYAERI